MSADDTLTALIARVQQAAGKRQACLCRPMHVLLANPAHHLSPYQLASGCGKVLYWYTSPWCSVTPISGPGSSRNCRQQPQPSVQLMTEVHWTGRGWLMRRVTVVSPMPSRPGNSQAFHPPNAAGGRFSTPRKAPAASATRGLYCCHMQLVTGMCRRGKSPCTACCCVACLCVSVS